MQPKSIKQLTLEKDAEKILSEKHTLIQLLAICSLFTFVFQLFLLKIMILRALMYDV